MTIRFASITHNTIIQLERAASQLKAAARELEALQALPEIENVSYWEWKERQKEVRALRQPVNMLPVEFTCWTLYEEAEQLEARARVMRGGEQ